MHPVPIRLATPADAAAIAGAHRDSINAVSASDYSPEVIVDWMSGVSGDRVAGQMAKGTAYFVAVESRLARQDHILGFASHSQQADGHHIGVYVRGAATRQGVGRALFAVAEAHARTRGATEIVLESAIGAVPFWTAMGFESLAVGEHRLRSGRGIACVRMRKELPANAESGR